MTRRSYHGNPFALFLLLAVIVAVVTLVRLLPWLVAAAMVLIAVRYARRRTATWRPALRPAPNRPSDTTALVTAYSSLAAVLCAVALT
jgi:hypothetical protein